MSLADELETAIKAALPNVTLTPSPGANPPDHRWINVGWSRFRVAVMAPSTNAGIQQGYMLFTDLQAPPEVFHDVAPLLDRIEKYIELHIAAL